MPSSPAARPFATAGTPTSPGRSAGETSATWFWVTAARSGAWPTPRPPIATAGSTFRSIPRVVAARVAGLSHGFLVFDDTGSEWTRAGETFTLRLFPNRFVYSREQNRASAPYFTIELGPETAGRQQPRAGFGSSRRRRFCQPGEALVTWVTPRDDGPPEPSGSS